MNAALLVLLLSCRGAADPEGTEHHDEHGGEHATDVVLTPEAVAAARIEVAPAEVGTLSSALTLNGRITLDPRKEAVVSAWISGQVDAIAVRTGDVVRKGQALGTVQTPELGEAMAAYRAAKARDEAADARLERLRRLEADGVASRSQVLEAEAEHAEVEGALEAAEERLRVLGVRPTTADPHAGEHYPSHVPVRSPIAGTVLDSEATVGRQVEPGDPLFHVGDLGQVWLLLDVYERDLRHLAVGQQLQFSVDAWPSERFAGQVEQVGSLVEPDARTVEVRVVVDNPDGKLKPNMFATATIAIGASDGARGVVLPATAVQSMDGRQVVFVREGEGRFEARTVTVGERTADQVLVTDGIAAGDPVVVDGAFTLESELEKGELGEGHAH